MDNMTMLYFLPYGVGVIYAALGVPLALGRIAPNDWYGVRIPKTMANRDVWYSMNRTYGRASIVCGVLSLIITFLLHIFWRADSAVKLLIPNIAQVLLIVVSIVVTLRSS